MKCPFRIALVILFPILVSAGQRDSTIDKDGSRTISSAWSSLQQSMETMHAVMMTVKSSKDSDVDFVRLMIPHHEGAIDMARAELLNGAEPEMRRLAQEIITDQKLEIELMQRWLKRRVAPSAN